MFRGLYKWFKRLQGPQPSWSDKKHSTKWLLEHAPELSITMISRIYKTARHVRADGKYLEVLLKDLRSGIRQPSKSMIYDTQWVEDEMGERPIGIYAQIYIVEMLDKMTICLVKKYGSTLNIDNKIKEEPTVIAFKEYITINQDALNKYFSLVYPY